MKVGIMSMQRIKNYGSFLQAYALSNILKNLGHNVEFVDFKIESCIDQPMINWKTEDRIKEYEKNLDIIKKFDDRYDNEFFFDLGITKRNERPELDTLVIGSDEVFNCLQSNPDVGYSLELFGKNCNAKKIISYAASCGATTVERLKKFNKCTEISELLNKFSAISVRDENTKQLVENLSNITPISHLDPVLIYDFSDVIIDTVKLENYIVLYGYPINFDKEESEYIRKFAIKHNKKIVAIGGYQSCADIFISAHPFEVLPYFKKADFVITNTFHGSIFSIKSHTPFVSTIKPYNSQKMSDLLNKLKMSDRIIDNYSKLDEVLLKEIDFSKSDNIIQTEKIRSLEYLKNNI